VIEAHGRDLPEAGEQRAWGWVEHLLTGGTATWQHWRAPGESQGRYLPGAQQLELLRRLNLAGPPSDDLAAKVLAASAAGRGRPDLELAGVGAESSFGPTPVDPGDLPAGELVRVAASVLADQLVDGLAGSHAGDHADKRTVGFADGGMSVRPARARPWWWRRGYRLVGDPELADPLRAQLLDRGRPPGGRQTKVLVLGADLATMTAHAWTHRAFGEGVNSWREWLRLLQERRAPPGRADLLGVCRAWEQRVGKGRVHLVLDLAAVSSLVGERKPLTAPPSVPAESGELARRVGSVLGLLVLPEVRETLLTARLRPRITAASTGRGRPLVIPPAHRSWVEEASERMRRGIRRAGYAVHGDLDALVPTWPDDVEPAHAGPSPDATLDLAIQVLLNGPDDRRTA
jgi:hypothetical protein